MSFLRLFSNEAHKGTKNYLKTQKNYEFIRTLIYFGISFALFAVGWITTKQRTNLLTVVAILGCLPASKSLVSTIMYFRYKGLAKNDGIKIESHLRDTAHLYDCVFTSYQKNFEAPHIAIKSNTISIYAPKKDFTEPELVKHLTAILKADQLTNVGIKVYFEIDKYLIRMDQLSQMTEENEENTLHIAETLRSVSL